VPNERTIFRRGSTTFFISSLFFPRRVRSDVFDLYSFVRVADDYVDNVPADLANFISLRNLWRSAAVDPAFSTDRDTTDDINTRVTKNMLRVSRKYHFDQKWVDDFLNAMESDLEAKPCHTIEDTLRYTYGSAEVIGLMMARIMGLPAEANEAAMLQGRAMQMINFIRDVEEDNQLGRQYIPLEDLRRFNLPDLTHDTAFKQPEEFKECIQLEIARYREWQAAAEEGYRFISKRYLIPLKTSSDMYDWTAREIEKDPLRIYQMKIKPNKNRVLRSMGLNFLP
jgi:phytoene synthase